MAKYFTFKELTGSETAKHLGICNSRLPLEAAVRLDQLMDYLLDPVRVMWGAPVFVTSGYRCPELNTAVGGAVGSQHVKGEATDITTGSREGNRKLFDMIVASELEFDQLIDECNYLWLHLSYRMNKNRRQVLHLK